MNVLSLWPLSWFVWLTRSIATLSVNQGAMMATFDQYVQDQRDHIQATNDALLDIAGDIQALSDLVASLQQSQGTLTAEQQAVLNELDAAGKAIAEKATALAATTPPVAPIVA